MPIYEYACANCGHHLEVKQRLSDPALRLCPSCNAEALERLISESSFALRELKFSTELPLRGLA